MTLSFRGAPLPQFFTLPAESGDSEFIHKDALKTTLVGPEKVAPPKVNGYRAGVTPL